MRTGPDAAARVLICVAAAVTPGSFAPMLDADPGRTILGHPPSVYAAIDNEPIT